MTDGTIIITLIIGSGIVGAVIGTWLAESRCDREIADIYDKANQRHLDRLEELDRVLDQIQACEGQIFSDKEIEEGEEAGRRG